MFDYLETRNFNNFPKVISSDDREIKTEYIESKDYHEMTKGVELIKTVSHFIIKHYFLKILVRTNIEKYMIL